MQFLSIMYLVTYLSTALLLSTCFAHLPKIITLPFASRTLGGLATTPLLMAMFPLIGAATAPNTSRYFYILTPSILAFLLVFIFRKYCLSTLAHCYKSFVLSTRSSKISTLISLALFVLIIFMLITNSFIPIWEHDTNIYFGEAQYFANNPSLNNIPTFDSAAGTFIKIEPHTFLFPSYISYALIACGKNIHTSGDYLARLSIQLIVLSVFVAIAALSTITRNKFNTFLAITITLFVPHLGTLSYTASRDAFRILPMLLLLIFLVNLFKSTKHIKPKSWFVGVFVGLSISAHTLNIPMLIIFGCILAVVYAFRVNIASLLKIIIPIFIPALISFIPYIINLIKFGSFYGYGIRTAVVKDTPLFNYGHKIRFAQYQSQAWYQAIWSLFNQYGLLVPIASIAVSIYFFFLSFVKKLTPYTLVLSLYLLSLTLVPITISSTLSTVSLKTAMLMNYRYPLVVFITSGLVISNAFLQLINYIENIYNKKRDYFKIIVCLLILTFTFSAWKERWSLNLDTKNFLNKLIYTLQPHIKKLKPHENWYADSYYSTYYLSPPPIFAYSKIGRKLIQEKKPDLILDEIQNLHIRFIAIYKHDHINQIGDGLTLNKVLNNTNIFEKSTNDYWVIYTLKKKKND